MAIDKFKSTLEKDFWEKCVIAGLSSQRTTHAAIYSATVAVEERAKRMTEEMLETEQEWDREDEE